MGNECSACNKDSQSKEQEIYLIKTHMRNDRKENLERVKSETKFFTVKEIINQNPEMYNKLQKIKLLHMFFTIFTGTHRAMVYPSSFLEKLETI